MRPRGEPTMVVRLPVAVVEELTRRAEAKGLTLREWLTIAVAPKED